MMTQSRNTRLGESQMLEFITDCSPNGLMMILSRMPDAVVTETVIKRLIDEMTCPRFRRWLYSPKDEAFDMLLNRSGLPEVPCQLLRSEFQDAQEKVVASSSGPSCSVTILP